MILGKKFRKGAVCASLLLVAANVSFPYASAEEPSSFTAGGEGFSYEEMEAQESGLDERQEASFRSIEKYLDKDSSSFDFSKAQEDPSIDEETLEDFSVGLISQGWNVQASESTLSDLNDKSEELYPHTVALRAACEGRNGFQKFPPAILLSSCAASAVQNAYAAGAGVAGIAAVLTAETGVGPALAGTIAGILAINSGIIGLCNSWGHGVKI
ncbi:hypothetical protein, partial [Corynebacterium mastitidis]|uniref:hypothetical protein n=1 Tax=Corynebacterium mastitidis TaxID=161890 RepID=UPI0012EA47F8